MDASPDRLVHELTPNTAILLAALGISLGMVEFNRPGRVLPGALGLLMTLLASAGIIRFGVRPSALALLLGCTGAYLLNLWRSLPVWLLALVTVASIVAIRFLVPGGPPLQIRLPVAILCGGLLGTASAFLTRVAHRARQSKALD